jgi:hypothetical protein
MADTTPAVRPNIDHSSEVNDPDGAIAIVDDNEIWPLVGDIVCYLAYSWCYQYLLLINVIRTYHSAPSDAHTAHILCKCAH